MSGFSFDGTISFLIMLLELTFLYRLIKHADRNRINKMVFGIVSLLAGYQAYEFLICFFNVSSPVIVYLALADISFLPPMGLALALTVFGVKDKRVLLLPFVPFIFLLGNFLFNLDQIAVTKCTVLYASYNYPLGFIYGFFYFFLIYISIYLFAVSYFHTENESEKRMIKILIFGFVFTFIPANVLFLLSEQTVGIVESLQCKIAFVLAFSLLHFGLKNVGILTGEVSAKEKQLHGELSR